MKVSELMNPKGVLLYAKIDNSADALGILVELQEGIGVITNGNAYYNAVSQRETFGGTTAIGGGMIRDVLLREMPFVLKKRVYAVAAILGALGYALLLRVGLGEVAAYGLGMLITTAVRMLATVFKWNLPKALE